MADALETMSRMTTLPTPPQFFIQQLLDFTQGYIMLCVLSLGIFGNTISFIIFFRVRKRADATVQYLSCLATSDTGVILFLGITDWLAIGLKHITNGAHSFSLMTYSTVTCKILATALHIFECISAWVIVAFSTERAFVVWFPLRRAGVTSTRRKRVIFAICVGAVLVSIHRFAFCERIPGTPVICFYATAPTVAAVLWQFDIAMYNYVPCTLIFLANILILVALFLSRDRNIGRTTKKSGNEGRLLVSLMLVSTIYVVLLLPLSTLFTYLAEERENLTPDESLFLWYVMKFLTLVSVLNYCFNFIIYGCTLSFYREEAVKMFTMFCRRLG